MKGKLSSFSFLILTLLFSSIAFAQFQQRYTLSYRSNPAGMNAVGSLTYSGLMWGTKEKGNPLYGYYKIGGQLGGAPTAAVFLEVAPIAPVVFEVQKSATYRFLNSSVFDCNNFYCFGVTERTDYSVRAAGKYEDFMFIGSYMWRDIKVPESSKPVMLELENFTVLSGDHKFNESTLFFGYGLWTGDTLGIVYTQGEFSDLSRRYNSSYGIYHWKKNGIAYTAGIGNFNTDQPNLSGSSLIFSIGKTIGESLSLF